MTQVPATSSYVPAAPTEKASQHGGHRVHVPLNKHSYARALLSSDPHLIKLDAAARTVFIMRNTIKNGDWRSAYVSLLSFLSSTTAKSNYPMSKIHIESPFTDVLSCVYNRTYDVHEFCAGK